MRCRRMMFRKSIWIESSQPQTIRASERLLRQVNSLSGFEETVDLERSSKDRVGRREVMLLARAPQKSIRSDAIAVNL